MTSEACWWTCFYKHAYIIRHMFIKKIVFNEVSTPEMPFISAFVGIFFIFKKFEKTLGFMGKKCYNDND